jgi:hypothetical protein
LSAVPRAPLPTLLSHALVAFTIELDNEWERRMPFYKTTDYGGRGVWGVSLRQWSNFMRYVPLDRTGITVRQLTKVARAKPALDGMRRWGYVSIDDGIVRPKHRGVVAAQVWEPLPAEIEFRWRERFGAPLIDGLRELLEKVAVERGEGLPDWLTTYYGGYADSPVRTGGMGPEPRALSTLFSIPLQLFALAYERESVVSLQSVANVLQWLGSEGGEGVAAAELPGLSGVAAPALQTAVGILVKGGFVEQGQGRGRQVTLTDKGAAEVSLYRTLPLQIEQQWAPEGKLRTLLEQLFASDAPLWPALEPPPESWRSQVPRPSRLPDHPHPRQGGHPDGV